jgi:hypothetical protein
MPIKNSRIIYLFYFITLLFQQGTECTVFSKPLSLDPIFMSNLLRRDGSFTFDINNIKFLSEKEYPTPLEFKVWRLNSSATDLRD